MNWEAFLQPSTIIAFLSALGLGTIVQQLLNRKKNATDMSATIAGMAKQVAEELRIDNTELRARLDSTEQSLNDIHELLLQLQKYADKTYKLVSETNPEYPPPPAIPLRRITSA